MILPIHLLDSFDVDQFGSDLVRFSQLGRLGFPLAEGMVVSFPATEVESWLLELGITDLNTFETRKERLVELFLHLIPQDDSLLITQSKQLEKGWPVMVERWLNEIHSHFLRFNQLDQKNFYL